MRQNFILHVIEIKVPDVTFETLEGSVHKTHLANWKQLPQYKAHCKYLSVVLGIIKGALVLHMSML